MSHLFNMFAKQVTEHCDSSTMPVHFTTTASRPSSYCCDTHLDRAVTSEEGLERGETNGRLIPIMFMSQQPIYFFPQKLLCLL
ncbi:hypothetical protein J6590_041015 [Homalodisca vitripennis]|nr:hypothetical protein J6590_041015 [Homalodisca vitripennis]